MKEIYTDWSQVPNGLFLLRATHERCGDCLHLHLRTHDGPWHEQPRVPVFAAEQQATDRTHTDFWQWAEKSLPIYQYPTVIKSSN